MLRKALLASVMIAAVGAVAAPAAADNIALDTWYTFSFGATGSALAPGFTPGTSPAAVIAPSAPWTITLSGPAVMTVTDVEISGDEFTFFDNGAFLGTTSASVPNGSSVGECISCALADPNYSHGSFLLGAGVHNLTGVFNGVITFGDGDFKISSAAPEPSSWAMMITGLAGLGGLLRSRRKSAAAAA
jgi:hypothetical protein